MTNHNIIPPYMKPIIHDSNFEKWWNVHSTKTADGNEVVDRMIKAAALKAWIAGREHLTATPNDGKL